MRRNKPVLALALAFLLLGAGHASAFRGGHMRGGRHRGGFRVRHHRAHHHAAHLRHVRHMHHLHRARVFARHVVFGAWLLSLPRHATVVYVGTDAYYYTDGVYYVEKGATCYVTVPPPTGAVIPSLPEGAVTIRYDDETYHYYVGSFYLKSRKGYQVAAAPVGATVTYAPKKAARKTIDGKPYYVYAGVYYLPKFVDGLTLYQVVAKPGAKQAAALGVLDALPVGNLTVEHDGKHYYYADGDWFVEVEGGYRATKAPVGASVPYLPETAEKKGKGFVCEGAYYAPYAKEGVTLYKVEAG